MRLIASILVAMLASSSNGNDRALDLLRAWITAVDEHATGERDAALDRIAAWRYDEVDMMLDYVEAFADLPVNTTDRARRRLHISPEDLRSVGRRRDDVRRRGDFDRFLKRAALLHTDAALFEAMPVVVEAPVARELKPSWRRNEPEPAVDVKSFDATVDHYVVANPHWQMAMDLLEALPSKPRRDPIVAQWYRAIAAHYAQHDSTADAMRLFDRAHQITLEEPGVLFAEACLQETLGSPNVQNFARTTVLPNGLTLRGVEAPQAHFRRAESLLKRALAAQPDFVEARLRLGHVLLEQRQHEAALPHLAQVISAAQDPVLIYYAHLFSGDASLALGRASDARTFYERALASHPDAQSARIRACRRAASGRRPHRSDRGDHDDASHRATHAR